jgi:hypothetical protein
MTIYAIWHNNVSGQCGGSAEVVAFDMQGRGAMRLIDLLGGSLVVVTKSTPLISVETFLEGVSRRVAETIHPEPPGRKPMDRSYVNIGSIANKTGSDPELHDAVFARYVEITRHWFSRYAIDEVRSKFFFGTAYENNPAFMENLARMREAEIWKILLEKSAGLRAWAEKAHLPGLIWTTPENHERAKKYQFFLWQRGNPKTRDGYSHNVDYDKTGIRFYYQIVQQWLPAERVHTPSENGVLAAAELQ